MNHALRLVFAIVTFSTGWLKAQQDAATEKSSGAGAVYQQISGNLKAGDLGPDLA